MYRAGKRCSEDSGEYIESIAKLLLLVIIIIYHEKKFNDDEIRHFFDDIICS